MLDPQVRYESSELGSNGPVNRKMGEVSLKRQFPFLRQFALVFERNFVFLKRNPRTFRAMIGQVIFSGLLTLALFWKTGESTSRAAVFDWIGLAFMTVNNFMFLPAMSVTLQLPL